MPGENIGYGKIALSQKAWGDFLHGKVLRRMVTPSILYVQLKEKYDMINIINDRIEKTRITTDKTMAYIYCDVGNGVI